MEYMVGGGYGRVSGRNTWDSVIVQASIRVTMKTFETTVKSSAGQLILPSGTHCELSSNYCVDSEGAENYWLPMSTDSCHFEDYDILYEGPATKLLPKENQDSPTIYTVTTQQTTFALTKKSDFNICGYTVIQTEHPKLFILETDKAKTFKTKTKISVDNLDIFSYVNSKFIYVEKHIRRQLTQLYRDIMEQKCALEQQILQNALSLASIAPDEMAYRIMKAEGYTAVTIGEVIHIIKCIPVQCKLRTTSECYNELPVTHRNSSLFLLPRSRILIKTGTPRECSHILPIMYKLHNIWFHLTPKPIESLPPPIIRPLTHPKWHYISPTSLATSGIYSNEDLERLRNHIMFPVEKPAALNNLAKGAMGESLPQGSISILGLLDEDTINHIVDTAGKRIWKGFLTFGTASAGIFAILIILRIAKLIVDTFIHGYALHTIYGWSIYLLGAIWTSVTNLLLYIGGRRQEQQPAPPTESSVTTTDNPQMESTTQKSKGDLEEENPQQKDEKPHTYSQLRYYLKDNP